LPGVSAVQGLRERKKQRTRQKIVREAMKLFARRGFESTTINDIAAAAEIAPRTFFGYFPSKEDVVFHDFDEVFERFARRLRDRPPSVTVFDALREWVVEWLSTRDAAERARDELIAATPQLQSREHDHLRRFSELIAEGVAADLGVPADSLRPRMVSAATAAALETLRDYEHAEEIGVEEAVAVLDEAIAFLQGGLRALRKRG
jgi:AcrR family transcriptional regulator